MKKFLRPFFANVLGLWLVSQAVTGIVFAKGFETMAVTAAVLGLFNLFVRPLVNLLLLPLNLLTLGTFRWLVNVGTLYLVTILVPDFQIKTFYFQGFSYQGFSLPPTQIGTVWAFILISFMLSFVISFIFWLAK